MGKDRNLVFILAFIAAGMGVFAHSFDRLLFGDECTELLQALDRPQGFFILTPSFSANWIVSSIESFVTYIYSFFLKNLGFQTGLLAIRAVHIVFFTMNAVILFWILRRLVSSFWAFSGSLLFIFSNYALCFMQILTRNSITPFWVLSSILLISIIVENREKDSNRTKQDRLLLLLTVVICTLGLISYSGFRAYVTALSLAFFIHCMLYNKNKMVMALFFPLAILGLLYGLITVTHTGLEAFIYRGSYAVVEKKHFLSSLYQMLVFPFKFYKHGHFVIEQAHVLVGRSPLPFYLWPFFCFGFFLSFSKSLCKDNLDKFHFLVLLRNFLLLSMVLFLLVGPNLKYLYGLWPVLIIFCVLGMEKLSKKVKPEIFRGLVIVCLFIFAFDQVYFFSKQMKNSVSVHAFLEQDADAKALVDKARPIIEVDHKPAWIYTPLGRDVALWYVRSTELKADVLDRWTIARGKGFQNLEKDTSLNLEGYLFTKNNLNKGQKSGLEQVLKNNPKLKWIEINL